MASHQARLAAMGHGRAIELASYGLTGGPPGIATGVPVPTADPVASPSAGVVTGVAVTGVPVAPSSVAAAPVVQAIPIAPEGGSRVSAV